ncbi:hypothetical protein Tco_1514421 [Tanacetum coccineum]
MKKREPVDHRGNGATTLWKKALRSLIKIYMNLSQGLSGIEYSLKDKNEAKTDKTEHGIGKSVKDRIQERYNSSGLTEDKEIELWVELKMLFEPDAENFLELQKYMHDPLKWWLYDMCAVHHVSTEKGQDIFMLVEKDYPLTKGLATLMLSNKLRVDQQSEMADELLTKIYNIANKPRKITPDYEASRARGFVLRSLELQSLA